MTIKQQKGYFSTSVVNFKENLKESYNKLLLGNNSWKDREQETNNPHIIGQKTYN